MLSPAQNRRRGDTAAGSYSSSCRLAALFACLMLFGISSGPSAHLPPRPMHAPPLSCSDSNLHPHPRHHISSFSSPLPIAPATLFSLPVVLATAAPSPIAVPEPPTVFFTFGYLRMAVSAIDSPSCLAGFFATIRRYNELNLVPGVRFRLNVTTIPCTTVASCRAMGPEHAAVRDEFFSRMKYFSAVFKPNAILAASIVDEAKRHGGGIPVIDPHDMRTTSHEPSAEAVIHFNPSWVRQADHLFTYMMQTAQCAHSGIFHGRIADVLSDEYGAQIAQIQQLFANGNYAVPPALEVQTASDAAFYDFFLSDSPRRQCFIVLGTHELLVDAMERLMAHPKFRLEDFRFFGVSFVMADAFKVHGDPKAFEHMVYTHWLPAFNSPDLTSAFAGWHAAIADGTAPLEEQQAIDQPREAYASDVLVTTYKGYMMMKLTLEVIRGALGQVARSALNTTANVLGSSSSDPAAFYDERPLDWGRIVDSFYSHGYTIDGHAFNPLVRSCPRGVSSSSSSSSACFCNTLTANSYIFGIDTADGHPIYVPDDAAKGQRDIAAVHYPTVCGYIASSWSYPIAGLALFPEALLVEAASLGNGSSSSPAANDDALVALSEGHTAAEVREAYELYMTVFGIETREINYAPTAPTRALRFAPFGFGGGGSTNSNASATTTTVATTLLQYVDTIRPFVVYGSMAGSIGAVSTDVLILSDSLMTVATEDPPLEPHDGRWRWNVLTLQPVVADYIHSLVAYYHSRQLAAAASAASSGGGSNIFLSSSPSSSSFFFSHVFAVASTRREAELIAQSFATYGYLVPMEHILVSEDPTAWARFVADRLAGPPPQGMYGGSSSSASAVSQSPLFSPEASPPFSSPYPASVSPQAVYAPFILAASTTNPNAAVEAAARAAGAAIAAAATAASPLRGVLALACSTTIAYKAQTATNLTEFSAASSPSTASADVIFGAFRREWWANSGGGGTGNGLSLPPAELRPYTAKPRYHIATMLMQFSQQLYSQVYFDYKTTAAEVLYKMSSVSAADTAFGPFYNSTCSAEEIKANARDRRCQCTKGLRTIFVHSMRNLQEGAAESTRTGRFSWTMATCGVVYSAYVPPPPSLGLFVSAGPALSAAAIAGVSVGVVVLFAIAGAALAWYFSVNTRNNKHAPKDATKPFAIVFTDIQSSTALWARAPAAMSEAIEQHHRVIRKAVHKHNGYEVKTIGDSFMVAFCAASDAMQFAIDVQIILFEAAWSSEVNATYVELMLEAEAEEGGGYGPNDGNAGMGASDDPSSLYRLNNNNNNNNNNHHNTSGATVNKYMYGPNSPMSFVHPHHQQQQILLQHQQHGTGDDCASLPAPRSIGAGPLSSAAAPFPPTSSRALLGAGGGSAAFSCASFEESNADGGVVGVTNNCLRFGGGNGGGGVAGLRFGGAPAGLGPRRRSNPSSFFRSLGGAPGLPPPTTVGHPNAVGCADASATSRAITNADAARRTSPPPPAPLSALVGVPFVAADGGGPLGEADLHSPRAVSTLGVGILPTNDGTANNGAAAGTHHHGQHPHLQQQQHQQYNGNASQSLISAGGGASAFPTGRGAHHHQAPSTNVHHCPPSFSFPLRPHPHNAGGEGAAEGDSPPGSPLSHLHGHHAAYMYGHHHGGGGAVVDVGGYSQATAAVLERHSVGSAKDLQGRKMALLAAKNQSNGGNGYASAADRSISPPPPPTTADANITNISTRNHYHGQTGHATTTPDIPQPLQPAQLQLAATTGGGGFPALSSTVTTINGASTVALAPALPPPLGAIAVGVLTATPPLSPLEASRQSKLAVQMALSTASDRSLWHGLRVRIGVHFGMGDIRKDPVTLGYDYYGTVVNTAARVEGVGHGGQILVTDDAVRAAHDEEHMASSSTFALRRRDLRSITISLGPQPLRGLDEPIRLHQLVPEALAGRRFPPLRLHVEKETEDESESNATTGTATDTLLSSNALTVAGSKGGAGASASVWGVGGGGAQQQSSRPRSTSHPTAADTPEAIAARLCATRQYGGLAPADVVDRYTFFTATFGPTPDKYKAAVIAKLAEAWGVAEEAAYKNGGLFGGNKGGGGGGAAKGGAALSKRAAERLRVTALVMRLMAKISKSAGAAAAAGAGAGGRGSAGGGSRDAAPHTGRPSAQSGAFHRLSSGGGGAASMAGAGAGGVTCVHNSIHKYNATYTAGTPSSSHNGRHQLQQLQQYLSAANANAVGSHHSNATNGAAQSPLAAPPPSSSAAAAANDPNNERSVGPSSRRTNSIRFTGVSSSSATPVPVVPVAGCLAPAPHMLGAASLPSSLSVLPPSALAPPAVFAAAHGDMGVSATVAPRSAGGSVSGGASLSLPPKFSAAAAPAVVSGSTTPIPQSSAIVGGHSPSNASPVERNAK